MGLGVQNDPNQLAAFVLFLVFTPICTVAIVLRFLATRHASRKVGWEDWFALLAYIWYVIYAALLLAAVVILNGRSLPYGVPMNQIIIVTKIGYTFSGQYCLQQGFAKLSLLFLYHRIFSVNRAFKISIWVVGAIQVAWSIATFLVHIFECNPPEKVWDPLVSGHCVNSSRFLAGGETVNSLIDLVLVGMAIWMVQSLQMSTSTKLKLAILFALGGLAGIIGFIKIGINYAGDFSSLLDADWALIQQAFSVICCCAPIYKHIMPRIEMFSSLKSMRSRLMSKMSLQSTGVSSRDNAKSTGNSESRGSDEQWTYRSGEGSKEFAREAERYVHVHEQV